MRERSPEDSCEPERARAKRTHSVLGPTADNATAGYTPRSPEQTLLHRIIGEQLEAFLARARETGQSALRFIEQELRAYLRCGVLAHGFLRLHCDACKLDRLVPFSCKRRGFCPSCGGRRMADTAAHLVDCVLPEVPIRQWVLTLPHLLRYRCAYNARLTSQVLRAFLRALFTELRRRARVQWDMVRGQCGAVTFIQRFGSALNLNVHFHTLALDGVYTYAPDVAKNPRFLPLPPPSEDEVARVLSGTARRIHKLLEARANSDDDDALARDEPLLAHLTAASLRTRIATGPQRGDRWRRLGDRVDPDELGADPDASPRVPAYGGMSLHAAVGVPARDRRRLERLIQYVARPPLAHDRLEKRPDGRLTLRLKIRWRDGTTHILMERSELIERLVPLIPPPRAHQVRYHGILAPCASQRDWIVPGPETDFGVPQCHLPISNAVEISPAGGEACEPKGEGARRTDHRADANGGAGWDHLPGSAAEIASRTPASTAAPATPPRRLAWAALLQRVFEVDALRCPDCGARMRLLAAIEDPEVARKILECLDLPARAPPLQPAPSTVSLEPEADFADQEQQSWEFDQTRPDTDGTG
jgi:hypothetical protein